MDGAGGLFFLTLTNYLSLFDIIYHWPLLFVIVYHYLLSFVMIFYNSSSNVQGQGWISMVQAQGSRDNVHSMFRVDGSGVNDDGSKFRGQ